MGCHPSHWRTPSFFKMVKTTFVRNDEWWKWIELETHDVIHLRVSFRKREEWLVLVGTRTFQKENEGNARAFVAWSAAMLRNMGCLRCLPPQSMLKNVCCPRVDSSNHFGFAQRRLGAVTFKSSGDLNLSHQQRWGSNFAESILSTFHNSIITIFWVGSLISFLNILIDGFVSTFWWPGFSAFWIRISPECLFDVFTSRIFADHFFRVGNPVP